MDGNIKAGYPCYAGGRFAQSAKHTHRSGFSRTVRPEKSEDLSPVHLKGDMVDSREMPKTFGKPVYLNGKIIFGMYFRTFQTGWTKNVTELFQDAFRHIDPLYLSFVDKSDTVALPGFIHNRSRNENSDSLLLEMPQHFPELLA